MSWCCRTCDHRNHAVQTCTAAAPALLNVCLITLDFQTALNNRASASYISLNIVLNNIVDAAESISHPSSFTTWSPCLSNPKRVAILTTSSETCRSATSAVFETLLRHLSAPPSVHHVYLDYSVVALASSSSSSEKVSCDVVLLNAPNPGVAGAMGKRLGWDPKRSSLSAQLEVNAPAAFSSPGDLIRDFWAWTELHPGSPTSPSSSVGSGYESSDARPGLMSTNSDEKNMSLFFAEDEERRNMEDETLVMIFQWSSHADGDRFKHPLQSSYGRGGAEVRKDLWDEHVAHPIRALQGVGAKADSFKLDLRGVEPRIETGKGASRERSGSKRLSIMASGFGERVSGLWSR